MIEDLMMSNIARHLYALNVAAVFAVGIAGYGNLVKPKIAKISVVALMICLCFSTALLVIVIAESWVIVPIFGSALPSSVITYRIFRPKKQKPQKN